MDRAVPQSIALLFIMVFAMTGEAQAEVVAMGGDMVFEALQLRAEQARNWSVTTNFYSWLYYATFPFCVVIYAVRKWYGENWTKWLILRDLIDDVEEIIIGNLRKFFIWKLTALIAFSACMLIKWLLSQ